MTIALRTAVTGAPRNPMDAIAVSPDIDIAQLQRFTTVSQRRVRAGQYLYRTGQPFHALYLVYAGFLKTRELAEDGREQVTGFRMHGDLLGVEAIGLDHHPCDAVALADSTVWVLPYPPVLEACAEVPELQVRLAAALADEIRRDRSWMLTIGTLPAERRVAAFLLDLADRLAKLGFSGHHFILRMGRADIASFLALTHETVSRALSRLEQLGYIFVQRREVKLLAEQELRAFASVPHAVHQDPAQPPDRTGRCGDRGAPYRGPGPRSVSLGAAVSAGPAAGGLLP